FETVFVTGLERGLVPIAHAETPRERAEERRLLYVAMTRARHGLHLSYARERMLGTRVVRRARSPWLAPVEAARSAGAPGPPARAAAIDKLAEARTVLARATTDASEPEPDRALLGALVVWRRNLARTS